MDAETQPLKRRDNVIAVLNAAIDALNIAKDVSSITPAKAVFASVSTLLIMIKVCFLHFCVAEFPIHTHPGFDD